MSKKDQLPATQQVELLDILHKRFVKNMHRHKNISWDEVKNKLLANPVKLYSLSLMEETGGEPDVVGVDTSSGLILFYDCAEESPKGRRSLCYDPQAWESRKEHKPENSAIGLASEMGITMLNEAEYRALQKLGSFDLKTSSWVLTPPEIRKLGGAVFCDRRYDTVFLYHNGAESYYAARGFRGMLSI